MPEFWEFCMSINKSDLIDMMAKSTKMSKTACKDVLEAFVEAVEKSLKRKKSVVLTGFGTFSVMKRQARTGINPATGKKMQIPSKNVPKFKPGKRLKDLVAK